MHSSGQTRSVTERTEPSTDEQAYDALDGKAQLVDIYYLMKGGESYTASELSSEIEKAYQTTSGYLNKMEDRGVVTYKKDGKTKIWFLDRPYSEYDPETIVKKHTIVEEKEVPKYKEIEEVLWAYRALVITSAVGLFTGFFLVTYKYVFYDFYPVAIGSLPEVVSTAGLVCMLTVLVVAINEVS